MSSNKTMNVLLKSIGYFNYKKVLIDNSPEVEERVRDTFQDMYFDRSTVDIVYTDHMNISKFTTLLSEGKLHNGSMVLVDGIYHDKKRLEDWENLIASPNITVSMDMFHCGAIFIREEQVKEHFTIRI
ncbi:hypothetical protein [Allomuricauda sp. CP2A]|jgi:hypothetical protein|uniref:hypothetical protein n=1 Tax=Allomuricauda sp. CP2A TaxID=1848189 RepID=UPI001146366A|nr:hypothetical protein [Muricauda sp. CP2A]